MFEEENRGFREKFGAFSHALLYMVIFIVLFTLVYNSILGSHKTKHTEQYSPDKKVEELVINSDHKEDAYVTIIDENGKTFFEYYGLVNTTEKDGQQNIVIDLRENEGE